MADQFPKRVALTINDATKTPPADGGEVYIREMFWADAMAKLEKNRRLVADHEAEIARLTAEMDSAEAYAAADRKIAQKTAADAVMWKARAEKAEAERDRFEAALGRACLVGGTTYLLDRAKKAEADLAESRAYALALEQELRDRAEKAEADPEGRQAELAKAWQPIESAPKDGTFLIGGWTSNGQNHPMEWEVDSAWREGDSFGVDVDVSLESGETMQPTIDQITHWMPYPPPPEQNKND